MAMPMPRAVACDENEGLAMFLLQKWQEMATKEKFSQRLEATLSKAHKNLCDHKEPIRDLKDASRVKGIGSWSLNILKDYLKPDDAGLNPSQEDSEPAEEKRNKGNKGTRRYLPQKGSAPYAILITLYKETQNGKEFMRKQELIDAAEVSGLSRMPIGPSKSGSATGSFGRPSRDWYCGWSSMKTLIDKGLVVKSSCPAKYMLTEEGVKTAIECGKRSGLFLGIDLEMPHLQSTSSTSFERISDTHLLSSSSHGENANIATSEKGCSGINVCNTKRKATISNMNKMVASCVQSTLKLKGNGGISCEGPNQQCNETSPCSSQNDMTDSGNDKSGADICMKTFPESFQGAAEATSSIRPCTFSDFSSAGCNTVGNTCNSDKPCNMNILAVPPVENDRSFSEMYDVILILDDREQFGHDNRGNNSRHKVLERLQSQFQIQVQIRRLPVGDATWIARNRLCGQEYVLDFIVERKKVNDLSISIRDNRYKDQKLRLMRCGIQRVIYLIEGDMNLTDASESVKSAAFTSEILEGFDVQRTRDLADTVRKYGNLTHAIMEVYNTEALMKADQNNRHCMSFDEFVQKCVDLEKETVSDVFGVQLMQVPHVTEDIALTILDRYPTIFSLARAYASLEGNHKAQEELLKDIPVRNKSKLIGSTISKSIYKLFWVSQA